MNSDERFMKKVISLAKKGLGSTFPNPVVGALLVKDGTIISSGYHKKAGMKHAEVDALSKVGEGARGSTMYVNLEPCNHYGRTPPCTKAILESGVSRVVVGIKDPNKGVTGGGCEFLQSKGVDVRCGVLEEECSTLNEVYIKNVVEGKVFVAVKVAMTLDGWIATKKGDSKWITNQKSRRFVHRLRGHSGAILVGVDTVIADNPKLTPYMIKKSVSQPFRIVVDTHLRTPLSSNVFNSETAHLTIIASGSNVDKAKIKRIENLGAKVIQCELKNGQVDMVDLFDRLSTIPIGSVLVEGGARIYNSIMRGDVADKFYLFFAPKILGGGDGIPFMRGKGYDRIEKSYRLRFKKVRVFDGDIMIEAYPLT
jgi:diaminohydroxyphosphoribosylaminopyrimidine deaminase / 5-amino-6-(5-phosphoribosylamino)uracil reductase